jgi:four helix bundle protein
MGVQSYRELVAWQKAMDLVTDVYKVCRSFPKEEVYGLTQQVRRAAVSVPANIAEGQGRGSGKEFSYHLRVSHGSLQELETLVLIARRLEYVEAAAHDRLVACIDELSRILRGLRKSVRPDS